MARIAGVDLPVQKRLYVGLTSIYGIGQERARKLAAKAGVDHTKKVRDLTEDEVNHLRQAIESEGRVEGDLRKEIQMNIRRLIEIQAYRGIRHRRNLPVRGQRTHTNARTRKGPRRGAVAAKKKTVGKKGGCRAQHAAPQFSKIAALRNGARSGKSAAGSGTRHWSANETGSRGKSWSRGSGGQAQERVQEKA